jgi:hypothetical protein
VGEWIDVRCLDELLVRTEYGLVDLIARGRTLWSTSKGRNWVSRTEEGDPGAASTVDALRDVVSGQYETICIEWQNGMDLVREVEALTNTHLQSGGQVLVLGVPDVLAVLSRWPETAIQPTHVQPYGLLSNNKVLDELLGADAEEFRLEVAEAIADENTSDFWLWFEPWIGSLLPPTICSRSIVVFGSEHSLGDAIERWERWQQLPIVDAAAISWLLGSEYELFRCELNRHVDQGITVQMGPRHLIAILSEALEWRIGQRVDFLSLFDEEVRANLTRLAAWRLAYVAHRTLEHPDFSLDETSLTAMLDYEMYKNFSDILMQRCEGYS